MILLIYLLAFVLHSASRAIIHISELIRFNTSRGSGCDILPSLPRCFMLRLPLNTSMFIISTSPITLAIERCLSTWKASSYEENRTAGIYLLLLQMSMTSCLLYVMYCQTTLTGQVIYYCIATNVRWAVLTYISFGSLIILQLFAIAVLCVLVPISNRISLRLKNSPSLRCRYTVEETKRTIYIVLPFCAATCLCTSSFLLICVVVIASNQALDYTVLFTLIDGSLLLPEFALLLPVIFIRMTRHVAEKKENSMKMHLRKASGDHYFSILSDSWNEMTAH